jgi:flavin reductase ActVB
MSSKGSGAPATGIGRADFCSACAKFPTGVTVVTVRDTLGSPHGMTASSFTSVSLDPPLVLVCVDHRAKLLEHVRRSKYLGINILSEGQHQLSVHFARREQDRFGGVDWTAGHHGVPLIPGVLAALECRKVRMVDAGDHAILIAEVLRTEYRDGRPLVYFGSGYHKLDGSNGG